MHVVRAAVPEMKIVALGINILLVSRGFAIGKLLRRSHRMRMFFNVNGTLSDSIDRMSLLDFKGHFSLVMVRFVDEIILCGSLMEGKVVRGPFQFLCSNTAILDCR
jgi:hypothetical protein